MQSTPHARKPLNRDAKLLIGVFGVLVLIACVATFNRQSSVSYSSPSSYTAVALRAAPGNSQVQMFDALKDGPDVKVSIFSDGFRCSKVSDLIRFGEGDTAMFFYKLNCGGRVGYVNADWVRNY